MTAAQWSQQASSLGRTSEADNGTAVTDVSQDPEEDDPPRSATPPQPGPNAPPPPKSVRVQREAAHYAGLVLASMVGCLIRLGVEALGSCTSYHGPSGWLYF